MSDSAKRSRKQIIIEFTKPLASGFPIISWIIRLSQWKMFRKIKWKNVPSHVRIKFFDRNNDVWWIYEASQTSVKLVGNEYISSVTRIIKQFEFYIDPKSKKKMLVTMNKNAGVPYAKLQLIGMIFVTGLKLIGIKVRNIFSNKGKYQVCIEALYWVLKDLEEFKEVFTPYDPDTMDLYDLFYELDKLNKKGS